MSSILSSMIYSLSLSLCRILCLSTVTDWIHKNLVLNFFFITLLLYRWLHIWNTGQIQQKFQSKKRKESYELLCTIIFRCKNRFRNFKKYKILKPCTCSSQNLNLKSNCICKLQPFSSTYQKFQACFCLSWVSLDHIVNIMYRLLPFTGRVWYCHISLSGYSRNRKIVFHETILCHGT